jgi:hypothetical protein
VKGGHVTSHVGEVLQIWGEGWGTMIPVGVVVLRLALDHWASGPFGRRRNEVVRI